MYFVLRDGRYHDATHVTFRQFMNGALKNSIPSGLPNMGDWTNHLGSLFPDVRLKRFLEMRGADGGPWRRITALPAFWVGLLYDDEALSAAESLTSDWRYDDVMHMRNTVPVQGLKTPWREGTLLDVAREAVAISFMGLRNRAKLNAEGRDESIFLAPLEEVVARGSTLAEVMLAEYHSVWGASVEPAFMSYAY
jgi:glutamate--cysteine ligase